MGMEEESCLETQIHLIRDFHCWCWCWRLNLVCCGVEDDEDAGGVTQDDVTNAYEQAKQDIENATEAPALKSAIESFKTAYGIEEN